jgi:hypothetical protein
MAANHSELCAPGCCVPAWLVRAIPVLLLCRQPLISVDNVPSAVMLAAAFKGSLADA